MLMEFVVDEILSVIMYKFKVFNSYPESFPPPTITLHPKEGAKMNETLRNTHFSPPTGYTVCYGSSIEWLSWSGLLS